MCVIIDIDLMLLAVDVPALHGFQKVRVLSLLLMLMEICMSMKRQACFDRCGCLCALVDLSVPQDELLNCLCFRVRMLVLTLLSLS